MVKKYLKKYNDLPVPVKATIWFVFCSVVQKSISLITTPIFTRIMSTEQYGQFSVYNSWLQIFTIFTTFRLNYAVFNKGMTKYKDDRDAYTSTMQTITVILTTIFLIIYLIFRKQFNELTELPTFIMLAMIAELYMTPAIDFWTVRKRYEYIYKPVVFRTIAMALCNAGIGVVAVLLSEEKGYARILSCVLVNVCFGSVLFAYNLRKGKRLFVKEYAKFAIAFCLPLILHYLSQYILDQSDRIMIQKMVGFGAAGIYSVAYNAGLVIKIVTQSVNNALVPWEYDKLEKQQFKILDDNLTLTFAFVGVCALLYSLFAPELMNILADAKYYEAVYVIPPVALGMYFMFIYMAFANVEFFYDCNKFTMFISMGGAALNIVLNYFGIKKYGYMAAAYTTLICYVIYAIAHYTYMTYSVKKKLGITKIYNTKRILLISTVLTGASLGIMLVYDMIIVRYSIILIIVLILILKRKSVIELIQRVKN